MLQPTFKCCRCGKTVNTDLYDHSLDITRQMESRHLCFDCIFWEQKITQPEPDSHVIDGSLYVGKPVERHLDRWERQRDTTLLVHNLRTRQAMGFLEWHLRGRIPENYRTQFPDEFRIISEENYEKIFHFEGPYCLSKGCWDRYDCFWYNKGLAEPKGPWNEIPSDHRPGDEMCESFINKNKLYNNGF